MWLVVTEKVVGLDEIHTGPQGRVHIKKPSPTESLPARQQQSGRSVHQTRAEGPAVRRESTKEAASSLFGTASSGIWV